MCKFFSNMFVGFFVWLELIVAAHGQCIDHTPVWSGDSNVSYNLLDDYNAATLDPPYIYAYTRAGNVMAFFPSSNEFGYVDFQDVLTPPDNYESELFFTFKKPFESSWRRIPWSKVNHAILRSPTGRILGMWVF